VTLNFVNADIEAVSRAIGAMLNRDILVDPRVKGNITVYNDKPQPLGEAYRNYLSALRGLGFTVVESGGFLKVVPEADAKQQHRAKCEERQQNQHESSPETKQQIAEIRQQAIGKGCSRHKQNGEQHSMAHIGNRQGVTRGADDGPDRGGLGQINVQLQIGRYILLERVRADG